MKNLLLLISLLLLPLSTTFAAPFNNNDALQDLTEVKAVFDINQADPHILKLRLELIEESYQQLKAAGVTPTFVLTFRGKASFFLTSGLKYIDIIDLSVKNDIKILLEQFSEQKIPMKQCAIAARLSDINTDDFLPQIEVVTNGYVSLMGYQNKGYAFIPME